MIQRVCPRLLVTNVLFISLSLSACKASSCSFEEPITVSGEQAKLIDKSLLTGEPCEPPCWYGITPGTTSEAKAIGILKELEFINPDSINVERNSRGGTIAWRTVFAQDKTNFIGISFDKNGIVYSISIYDLWYEVTLQELINAIGKPDGILTRPIMHPDGGSSDCMIVDVVWFDKGLEVSVASVSLSEESLSVVEPNLMIRQVDYFPSVSNLKEYIVIQGDSYSPRNKFVEWEEFK